MSPFPIRRGALVLALASLAACFDAPVKESLELRFLANGAVVASSTIEIADRSETNPALARRLLETRRAILDGSDDWSRRFAALEPAAEKVEQESRLGVLTRAVHRAVLAEPGELAPFFGDTPLAVSYTIREGVAELSIAPGQASRATRGQRQKIDRSLDEWSEGAARYLAAGGALWTYLDAHPERARACFGALFSDVLAEGTPPPPPLAPGRETELVEALDKASDGVVAALLVPDGEAFSLDELSRLAFDPFPAPLTVRLPGAPLEVEGFVRVEDALAARGPGLWAAFESFEGRWLAPDPALASVAASRASAQPKGKGMDLDAFLARARTWASVAPSADEIRNALAESLRPAPLYRATWRVDPDADPGPFTWEP